MSEWYLTSLLAALVIGFVCGLLYSLRLYKKIEADCDREWAKRHGMPEVDTQHRERTVRIAPVLRQRRL